jgi:putative peptidoglycan lipid II flippase
VYGLAYGVILGAIMHLLVQVPIVTKHKFFPKFIFSIDWNEILQVIKQSLPRTLALSCNSLAFIFIIAIASTLKSGSISLFTFSYNLQSVPVGIIGISYAVAAFPVLVKSFSIKDIDNFINHIISTARQVIFWSLPVIVLMIVLRAQIVRVVLGSNTFSWADTRLTAAATALFIICLASQGLVLLFVRGYYAAGNTKKPLLINVFSSVMVIAFAYALLYVFRICPQTLSLLETLLRVKDVPGTIMLALPFAFTLGSLLNFFLIWIMFKKDFLRGGPSRLYKTFIEAAVGALVMGVIAYFSLNIFDDIFTLRTGIGVFMQGFFSGIIGISFGVFVLALLKNRELSDLASSLKKKFWRNRVVIPEQGDL